MSQHLEPNPSESTVNPHQIWDNIETPDSNGSFPTSTSLGSQMHQLLVYMPAPGTSNAPYFAGPRAHTFLETLRRLTTNAGLLEDDSVNQIYWYSSQQVQDTICYLDEFDVEVEGKNWEDARNKILQLYGSFDQDPTIMLLDLQNFCKHQNFKDPCALKSELEHYHQAFLRYAAPLIKKSTITRADSYYYFIAGLPNEIKCWLETLMPSEKRTKTDTWTIDETIKAVNTRFDTNSVFYNSWKDNAKSRSDRICLDDEGEHKPLATNTCIPTETTFEPFRDQGVPATSTRVLVRPLLQHLANVLSDVSCAGRKNLN
ncbi:hypothetical protein L218DRAFT_1002913 [Marasmius fiardii PR-910]|nr:hypothetical protein L218DRAFT_1002913 [Marasmius fiardii PR-910]